MKKKINNFMSIEPKMKKIDALVSQLDTEVKKICTDSKCTLVSSSGTAKKSTKKSKALTVIK